MNKRTKNNELYFRNVVRERDNWTCKECGSHEYVQAHHIKHYNGNNSNSANGITLCVYCHANKHPEVPRGLFISQAIKTEKEGFIPAGKLAKELNVHPRTIVRHARRLGIIQPMQQWTFTLNEAESIRDSFVKPDKINEVNFFISRTFVINTRLHSMLKFLSAFNQRTMSEELEEALEDHFKKYTKVISFFNGGKDEQHITRHSAENES